MTTQDPKFMCNRIAQTLETMLAGIKYTLSLIEEGEPPTANKMQWVFDDHMARLERQYRKLIYVLEKEEK